MYYYSILRGNSGVVTNSDDGLQSTAFQETFSSPLYRESQQQQYVSILRSVSGLNSVSSEQAIKSHSTWHLVHLHPPLPTDMELLRWTRVARRLIRTCHSDMCLRCSIVLGRCCQPPRDFFPRFCIRTLRQDTHLSPISSLFCLVWLVVLGFASSFSCVSSRSIPSPPIPCDLEASCSLFSRLSTGLSPLGWFSSRFLCERRHTAYTPSPSTRRYQPLSAHCYTNYIPILYIHSHQERGAAG